VGGRRARAMTRRRPRRATCIRVAPSAMPPAWRGPHPSRVAENRSAIGAEPARRGNIILQDYV
jgi:hypothetical protein